MMRSTSASYEDAVSKYAWMKYTGTRGKEVSQRTHKRMIREGDVFGLMPLKTGGRYKLIFADMPHVDFSIDKSTGVFLLERASKLRKLPDIVQRAQGSKQKNPGEKMMQRQLNRSQFDAARYSPRGVKSETVYGLDFANYQWRMVAAPEYPVKTTKGMAKLYKNDMIGVRFLRPGKGGLIVNTEGLFLKIDDAQFDLVVHDSNILPFNEWPKGSVDVDTIKSYNRQARRRRRRSAREEEEAQRLANNAKILEQSQQRKELRIEANKKKQERNAEMADLRRKVRRGEMDAPTGEQREVYEDEPTLRIKQTRVIEHEDLDDIEDEDLDLSGLDYDEQKLEDILARSPFAGDSYNIEESLGTLFGGDDSDEPEDTDLDLSDIDEPEDDEEEEPQPKVRPKAAKADKKGKAAKPAQEEEPADDEDADVVDEEEDDADVEEDADDSDPDESDEGDDASDDESMADDDADDGGDSSEDEDEPADDEDADSDAGDADDEDADASDAVDETEADEDEDSDVASAEKEAKETAKKVAAANKSTPSDRAQEAEEGDVLRFRADTKLQRDWVVLKLSTHSASDNILVYTLYDITNSPDEVRQVRINRARKQNLFDYAEHVKDMAPKLFNRVLDMADAYPVNKDPIAS